MDDTQKTKKKKIYRLGFYLLIIGFFCILISGILGLRIINTIGHRPPPVPRETNISLIQEWMTVPYISRTYGVPEPVIFSELNIDHQKYSKSSLKQIASYTNLKETDLVESVKKIITEFQSSHTKPPAN